MAEKKSESGGDGDLAATITKYYSSKLYRQVLGTLTTYLHPRLLSPDVYGVWVIVKMIIGYAVYAHMGTRSAVRYLIPRYQARGEEGALDDFQFSGFRFGLIVNLLVAVGLCLAAVPAWFSPRVRWGLVVAAVLVVLRYYHHFLRALLEANEEFGIVTKSIYVMVTLAFVSVILVYFFGIYGLYASVIIAEVGTIIYMRASYRFTVGGTFNWVSVGTLLRQGFPIVLLNITFVLVSTCDKIIVASMLGKEHLGYYGIAALALAFLVNIPGSARAVLEPRLMRTVENRSTQETVDNYIVSPMVKTAYMMPFLVGLSFLGLPLAIGLLLPDYVPAVPAAQTLALGSLFLGLAYVPRMVIVARHWQLQAFWWVTPLLAFNVALGVWLVRSGYGLFGVALSSSLSFLFIFGVLFALLWHKLGEPMKRRWGELLSMALPVAVMFGLVAAAWFGVQGPIDNVYLGAALSMGAYTAAYWLFYHAACNRIDRLPSLRIRNFL